MLRRLSLALLLLIPSLSSAADQDWAEVRSPHFLVITDAGEKKGREVALRFEQMRSAFGALLQRSTINIQVFTEIVAFRNRAEIEKYSTGPTGAAGSFLRAPDHQFRRARSLLRRSICPSAARLCAYVAGRELPADAILVR